MVGLGGVAGEVEEVARKCRDMVIEELLSNSELRREILTAIAREAATRSDLQAVEERLRGEIRGVEERLREDMRRLEARLDRLEGRLGGLEERVAGLEGRLARVEAQLSLFTRIFIAFNVPLLLGVLGILFTLLYRLPG